MVRLKLFSHIREQIILDYIKLINGRPPKLNGYYHQNLFTIIKTRKINNYWQLLKNHFKVEKIETKNFYATR